jgi:site-specific DNA recombinase
MNRFLKFGGAMARPIAGYIVPDDATTYDDWKRDDSATPIILEGLHKLKQTLNCSEVADFFNGKKFPVGPYCRRKEWDGKMVRRYFGNRLLAGMPGRGFKHTKKHHETGARIAVKNPDGPNYYECPHLAHVPLQELNDVNAMLEKQNRNCGRTPVEGKDPLAGLPRKRSRFPGHCADCWYCGYEGVWGGNGMTGNLMCKRAREWKCWNSVGYSGALAAQKVRERIEQMLFELESSEQQFRDLVCAAGQDASGELGRRWEQLEKNEAAQARAKSNLQESLATFGPIPMVKEKMTEFQNRERELARERCELERIKKRSLDLPQSVAELRALLEKQFDNLAANSYEFADLLRKLVPEFHVYLVRLCDGGHTLPRARVTIALDGIIPDAEHVPDLPKLLTRTFTIDLFVPPQRERIRETAVRLAAEGYGPREIARRIPGITPEKPTATAVQNALALDAKMKELGLDSPYIILWEPPEDYPKLRRHKNSKYRFEPRDGYQRPEI